MPTFREDPKLGSKVPMIKTADLNEQCVTNSKILDGCITKEKLAKGTVDATTLANKSVGTEKLSDSSVTNEKISNKAVSTEKLADESITKEKIFNASITTEKLQSGLRNTIASTYDKTIELDNQKANIADVGNAIERLENKIGERFIVEGDVTNLPDEEDLTSVNTIDGREVIKLNDRTYEPSNFSGKGYKILRKNIKKFDIPTVSIVVSYAPTSSGDITITVNDKVTTINLDSSTDTTPAIVATKIATDLKYSLDDYDISVSSNRITLTRHNDSSVSPSSINVGNTSAVITVKDGVNKNVRKNVLRQDMINDSDTVYEIKYDFDLNNTTIDINDNCILKFNGGSLKNGTINLKNTNIDALCNIVIFKNVNVIGSTNSIAYADWFGVKGYTFPNKIDVSQEIQRALDSAFNIIKFNIGYYYVKNTIILSKLKTIELSGSLNLPIRSNILSYYTEEANNVSMCENFTHNVFTFYLPKKGSYQPTITTNITGPDGRNGAVISKSCTGKGIVFYRDSETDSGSMYGGEINSVISRLHTGISNETNDNVNPTAITAFTIDNTINCKYAIDFGILGIPGSKVSGEIQPEKYFDEDNNEKIILGNLRNVTFSCFFWDLGASSTTSNQKHNRYAFEVKENEIPIVTGASILALYSGCIVNSYRLLNMSFPKLLISTKEDLKSMVLSNNPNDIGALLSTKFL